MRGWVLGLGFFVCGFCVCVFSFASPGTNNLFATVRKRQSLGPGWEEARGGRSVSRISLLVLSGMVVPKLFKC